MLVNSFSPTASYLLSGETGVAVRQIVKLFAHGDGSDELLTCTYRLLMASNCVFDVSLNVPALARAVHAVCTYTACVANSKL